MSNQVCGGGFGPERLPPPTVQPALAVGPGGRCQLMLYKGVTMAVREQKRLFANTQVLAGPRANSADGSDRRSAACFCKSMEASHTGLKAALPSCRRWLLSTTPPARSPGHCSGPSKMLPTISCALSAHLQSPRTLSGYLRRPLHHIPDRPGGPGRRRTGRRAPCQVPAHHRLARPHTRYL